MDTSVDNSTEEIKNSCSEVSLEDIQTRHRKERRELQSKIQALKKNAPKNDKKKRKDALEQIAKLEADLEELHLSEIKRAEEEIKLQQINEKQLETSHETDNDLRSCQNTVNSEENSKQQRVSKAQKRRDKKDRATKQREDEIKAYALDDTYSAKAVEMRKLLLKLKERELAVFNIPSDGDCLYNAVRHQLLQLGIADLTVKELRQKTSNYIKLNKESLIPYMTNPESGDMLTDEEFDKYCDDILYSSSWGGQIELKALSSILEVPIEIIQGDGSPTLQGAQFKTTPLTITYHRHLYSLGEHYNSTIPLADQVNDEATES